MTLTEEITALSARYCELISTDHHKDRDCHFYIQKVWSYGDPPYYQAYHYGYVTSGGGKLPRAMTAQGAERILRDFLAKAVADEEEWQRDENGHRTLAWEEEDA